MHTTQSIYFLGLILMEKLQHFHDHSCLQLQPQIGSYLLLGLQG